MKKTFIIDGYNMLYQWKETKYLMENEDDLADFARTKIIREVENYLGYSDQKGIIVFDAYLLLNNKGETIEKSPSLLILYTKRGETADERIEFIINQTPKEQRESLVIVTNDNLLQKMAFFCGANRLTCNELAYCFKSIAEIENKNENNNYCRNTLNKVVSRDVWCLLEAIRRRK